MPNDLQRNFVAKAMQKPCVRSRAAGVPGGCRKCVNIVTFACKYLTLTDISYIVYDRLVCKLSSVNKNTERGSI